MNPFLACEALVGVLLGCLGSDVLLCHFGQRSGGALYVDGNVEQTENSSAHVENCASEESGAVTAIARACKKAGR